MGRPKKSDSATSADWSFTSNAELMERLQAQAERWATYYGLDPDDALQEVYLWLSVRPKVQKFSIGTVLFNTQSRLQGLAKLQSKKVLREVGFDDELDH